MTIAIVGAAGQLGQDLQPALDGHRIETLVHGDVDICDADRVQKAIGSIRPDVVINSAAMTHVDDCEQQELLAFQINAVGARHIAQASRAVAATLIHISTDYVFDGKKRKPYVETDAARPLNVYGVSKLAGEFFVCNACPDHYVIRTSGLYGLHPCRGKGRNFVETMLALAESKETLRVVSDEILTPTFTEDVARQIARIIDAKPPNGIYHATNDGGCSWFDFAAEVFRLAGIKIDLQKITAAEWDAPAERPSYSVLENRALQREGIDEMPHWKDALKRYVSKRLGR